MKPLHTILALIASIVNVHGEIKQEPHSFPEYNKRFLENQLAPSVEPGRVFYVSVDGKDGAKGTRTEPFATLEAARDAVRKLKQGAGLPAGGVQVTILDGSYHRSQPFRLGAEDSGTRESPVVYRGSSATGVKISGGVEIDTGGMKMVEDKETLSRLNATARGKVMVVDVPKRAVRAFPGDGIYGQVTMDGHLLTLAQWPNRGYNHFGKIVDKGPTTRWLKPGEKPEPYSKEKPSGGKFTTRESLSPLVEKEFARSGDMQAQGYFHNDWYYQQEQVGGIDGGLVQLLRYTRYGLVDHIKSMPRRVRLVNVLAELDEVGEWYFDRVDKRLYVWPIGGFEAGKSGVVALGGDELVTLSGLHEYNVTDGSEFGGSALVEMEGTSFVTFRDLTFENLGNQAASISGGEHNLLAGCTIRNGDNNGVTVKGGRHNGITGCDIYGLETVLAMTGGDFAKLERCYNFFTNNDVHSCRRKGYGLIHLSGVGLYFAHNVLHDMNGGVNFKTVDSLLEYNEFYNIGYEMGDFNVAYCGSTWYTLNNVVRYNFVHHLIEPGGHPVCGFRNDDGGAGLKLYGNVFYRPGRGAAQGQGPLNDIQNNITMDCSVLWWTNKSAVTPEEIQKRWDGLKRFGTELPHGDKGDNIYIMEQFLGKEGWTKSPWIDEFPELARVIEINPFAQTESRVNLNYAYKVREPFHIHGGDGTVKGMESKESGRFRDLPREGQFILPQEIGLDAFMDVSSLDFRFRDGFEPMPGFKPIPFGEIGFVSDRFRPEPPDKAKYRKQTYERFRNDKGGRYDAKKVNARYPQPSYLRNPAN